MCMLFLFVNPNPSPDGYLMILASVRDEYYGRPSKRCHFWQGNSNIIGGMDMEEGRSGGTWLAMNSSGKVASLLNVIQPVDEVLSEHSSRGFLAVNYLESSMDGPSYLRLLSNDPTAYSPYTIITLDVSPSLGRVRTACYTNSTNDPPFIVKPGFHAFGNNSLRRPWKKVLAGKELFVRAVNRHRSVRSKESLVQSVFDMLADDTEHYPDPQLQRDADGRPIEFVQKLSAIFIRIPEVLFGTRTHSLILVDSSGHVDFIEKTMEEEMGLEDHMAIQGPWIETRYDFTIRDQDGIPSRL